MLQFYLAFVQVLGDQNTISWSENKGMLPKTLEKFKLNYGSVEQRKKSQEPESKSDVMWHNYYPHQFYNKNLIHFAYYWECTNIRS